MYFQDIFTYLIIFHIWYLEYLSPFSLFISFKSLLRTFIFLETTVIWRKRFFIGKMGTPVYLLHPIQHFTDYISSFDKSKFASGIFFDFPYSQGCKRQTHCNILLDIKQIKTLCHTQFAWNVTNNNFYDMYICIYYNLRRVIRDIEYIICGYQKIWVSV